MRAFRIAALLLAAASPLAAKPAGAPNTIDAAVASPDRSPDNVKLDESRKPAEVLKFLGLRPGMRVADPFGGNFYWAEITGRAVGPKGHVTVWEPQQFYTQKVADAYQAVQAKQPNVWMRVSPMESPDIPAGKYDFMRRLAIDKSTAAGSAATAATIAIRLMLPSRAKTRIEA